MSSPPPPYHLTHDSSGNRVVPEDKSLEDQLEWWKGFAYVLWLDLGYLLLLLLLLLSLALFVIKTPAVRDLSCIKPCADKTAEILSALWEGTVDNSKRARDKTAACWAALVAFLSGGCCEAVSGFFSKLCPKGAEAPYAKLEEVAVVAPASTASSPPVATPTAATETTAASSPGKVPAVVGKLTLHAKSGFDLMAMDAETATKKATSDPYLIVTMPGSAPKKSRVVEKTLHPVWDEKFEVGGRTLEELGALGAIKIQVMDKDKFNSEKMGVLDVPPEAFMALTPGEPKAFKNVAVQEATNGKLTFDLLFEVA